MATISFQVNEAELARARQRAAAENKTLEQMLQHFIEVLAQPPLDRNSLPANTRAALGIANEVPDKPYKDLLAEALLEKHGLSK
ncbi:MAG TPA: hypothetical protein VF669_05510 [Tepidisphaeraceae bacterium]|jgi:hypothetical protein